MGLGISKLGAQRLGFVAPGVAGFCGHSLEA